MSIGITGFISSFAGGTRVETEAESHFCASSESKVPCFLWGLLQEYGYETICGCLGYSHDVYRLMADSCNLATWSSSTAHLFQILTFSQGEESGHLLQPIGCTEVSFFTSSISLNISSFSASFSVNTLVLALGWVLTILAESLSTSLGYACGSRVLGPPQTLPLVNCHATS